MHSKLRRYLDPLDLELVEKACESARTALEGNHGLSSELDTDEELEASFRQELIEIALVSGVRDAETLRDILLATRSESWILLSMGACKNYRGATWVAKLARGYGPDQNAGFIGAIVTRAGKRAPSIEKLETINQIGRAC